MNFKTMLQEARKKQNLTQREMAKKLNVSDKTISKWETGVNFPDLKMLNQISKIIGISVADLLAADDLKETESGVSNDANLISKFKTRQIIALILFFFSVINLLWGVTSFPLLLLVGLLLMGSSLILFTTSIISFRVSYEERRNTQNLDRLCIFYTLLYFDSYLLVLFYVFITFYTAKGFAQLLLIMFQVIPFLLRNWILKQNHYETKKDNLNRRLIRFYWITIIVGNLIYGFLLTGWIQFDSNLLTVILIPAYTNIVVFTPLILGYAISLRRSPTLD